MPRLAEIKANGIISFNTKSDPWENGSKIGIRRYTLSRLNDEIEATFPVLKNADCSKVRKNKATRASERVSERKGDDDREAGTFGALFVVGEVETLELCMYI